MKASFTNEYTLEKRVFAAATFKGLWVSFSDKQKNVCYTLACFGLLCISRGKKSK